MESRLLPLERADIVLAELVIFIKKLGHFFIKASKRIAL
jgi:hypothetical protein